MKRNASKLQAQPRLDHIDSLRGIAVLSVAVHHFADSSFRISGMKTSASRAIETVLYDYLDLGRFGVVLFFIISGYCIANSILKPLPRPVATFCAGRILRIYPLYWLSLALAAAIYGTQFKLGDYLANITLAQEWLQRPHVSGVYWTLTIELTFYALCILLFVSKIMGNIVRLAMVSAALMAIAVSAGLARSLLDLAIPYAHPYFLSLMVAGAVLRRLGDAGTPSPRLIALAAVTYTACILSISLTVYGDAARYEKSWYQDFIPNAGAVIVFFVFTYGCRIRWRPLVKLGVASYSFYLFHPLVIEAFRLGIPALQPGFDTAFGIFAAMLAVSIIVSAITYLLVEKPSIALGRKFARYGARAA